MYGKRRGNVCRQENEWYCLEGEVFRDGGADVFGGGTGRVWILEEGECLGKSEMRGGGPAAPLCTLEALGSLPALGQLWTGSGLCKRSAEYTRFVTFATISLAFPPSSFGLICSVQVSECLF